MWDLMIVWRHGSNKHLKDRPFEEWMSVLIHYSIWPSHHFSSCNKCQPLLTTDYLCGLLNISIENCCKNCNKREVNPNLIFSHIFSVFESTFSLLFQFWIYLSNISFKILSKVRLLMAWHQSHNLLSSKCEPKEGLSDSNT